MASPQYSSNEVKIGFFVAFCGALFVGMLITYGKVSRFWRGREELHVAFENIGSLTPDAPVRYNGMEIGRVKSLRVLHLDENNLQRFTPFNKRDLDNLPLRPSSLKRTLAEKPDVDFDAVCRQELKNRTMIELCLEVMLEEDYKRYRVDDQIRIVTTIFGDSTVEIVSGNGAINTLNTSQLILGTSGDFFSNLAKSMGEVKQILSNVTDVVGADELRNIKRAQTRFTTIGQRLETVEKVARERSQVTAKKLESLGPDANASLTRARLSFEEIEPQARRSAESIKTSFENIHASLQKVQEEIGGARKELAADTAATRQDLKEAIDQSRPNFQSMRTNIQDAYAKFGNLYRKIDAGQDTLSALSAQTDPELDRFSVAAKAAIVNFTHTKAAANENKDLMISGRDKGEYDLNTATDIYRSLCNAVQRIQTASADMNEAAQGLDGELQQDSAFSKAVSETTSRLAAVRQPVDNVRNSVEAVMLPPFERKKAAWK